jgi:serine/threonine-protein phosphatase 2A regulatory subunit B'
MVGGRGKDLKRQTLLELVDYVNNPGGQKIFTETLMPDIMAMVTVNICRALPPQTEDFDPEEDEPVLEASWPHLQVVYEFFLRFIVSGEVNAKVAKKYVDQKFCLSVIDLFDSEDPRERDYLKTILHRIYGKFMSHRSFIRKAISNVFYRFVYETERHNGIGELLEILGSIINGFAMPLKAEHLQFLVRALVPLHKPKCVSMYHQQLSYCITQYVEKDPDTAVPIIQGIIKFWPWSCSSKQVIFLNELEEILELMGSEQLQQIHKPLFNGLAKWLGSQHFQVSERSLFLWNNEHLVNNGCLSKQHAHLILPVIYGPLHRNSLGHWNTTVEGLAQVGAGGCSGLLNSVGELTCPRCLTVSFSERAEALHGLRHGSVRPVRKGVLDEGASHGRREGQRAGEVAENRVDGSVEGSIVNGLSCVLFQRGIAAASSAASSGVGPEERAEGEIAVERGGGEGRRGWRNWKEAAGGIAVWLEPLLAIRPGTPRAARGRRAAQERQANRFS